MYYRPRYEILETSLGPMISESRVSVYDVMEMYDEGMSPYDICWIFNLRPLQYETAVGYINQHRERLAPELKKLMLKKAERERHDRQVAAELQKKIDQEPITPQKAAFYAMRDKVLRSFSEENHAEITLVE